MDGVENPDTIHITQSRPNDDHFGHRRLQEKSENSS